MATLKTPKQLMFGRYTRLKFPEWSKHHDQNMKHYCLTPRGMHHKWIEPLGCILSISTRFCIMYVHPQTLNKILRVIIVEKDASTRQPRYHGSWAQNCCMTKTQSQKLNWFYQDHQHNCAKDTRQPNRWAMVRMTHLLSEDTMMLEWAGYPGNWTGINVHTRSLLILILPLPDTTNWYYLGFLFLYEWWSEPKLVIQETTD